MFCQSVPAPSSIVNSLLSSELYVFKTSCAGAAWWMTCKDLDY